MNQDLTPFEPARVRFGRGRKDASAPSAEARPRTLFVLDGDPHARAVVDSALRARGYRVVSSAEPEAVLRGVREEAPDFVLVDLKLGAIDPVPRWQRRRNDPEPPGLVSLSDGYAILRALTPDATLPLRLVVSLRTPQVEDAVRFGLVDHVARPVVPGLLSARIDQLYEKLEPQRPVQAPEAQPAAAIPRPPADARTRTPPWSETELRAAATLAMPAVAALPEGLRSVLIADPDVEVRRALAGMLTPHGFTVHEAAGGEDALRTALAQRPWLILSEVNLPGVDGFEFCRQVRGHSLLRYTPLVFLSSWDDYNERELGLRLGADEYLSKQTPARELLIRLQLILKRYLDVGTRTRRGAGMEGTIELIGAIGMLQMCHLGRLTGTCTVRSGTRTALIRFRAGEMVAASCDEAQAAEAVYRFLAWDRGEFEFLPGAAGDDPPLQGGFDFLLLEGCRRLDEAQQAASAQTGP